MLLLRLPESLSRLHLLQWLNCCNLNGPTNRRWFANMGPGCSSSMMSLLPALFDSDASELEISFFLPVRMKDLAFATQLIYAMLILLPPILVHLLFPLPLMVPLNLTGLSILLVSMLLLFLIIKMSTLGMKKIYN